MSAYRGKNNLEKLTFLDITARLNKNTKRATRKWNKHAVEFSHFFTSENLNSVDLKFQPVGYYLKIFYIH